MTHSTTCDLLVRNRKCTCSTRVELQLRAKGDRIYLACLTCDRTAHAWSVGEFLSVAQVTLAEQHHLSTVHPRTFDATRIYDGDYENGLG